MSELYRIPALCLVALCHILVIYCLSEQKYSRKRFILYSCIYGVCFVGLSGWGYITERLGAFFVLYMCVVVCTLSFSCIVSRDCLSKKCFLFITYFCLFSTLDNSIKIIIRLVFPRISEVAGYYAAVIVRSAVLLLFLVLYEKYAAKVFRSLTDISSRRWWNLALPTLLFYLLQVALSVENIRAVIPPLLLFSLFVVTGLIMCASYSVVFSNISYMKKDEEAALVRQNAEYLSDRLSALQKVEETHRRLRHDMHHHLETIAEYAKTGNTAEILAYIREYSIEISETASKQYSVNKTVNSILAIYAGKAKESGISFAVKCNITETLPVRDIDLIALLGNLLENALHGCQKSGKEQPCIHIYLRQQNSRLIVVCGNTCADDLELSEGLPAERGIGISSILSICRKYDGFLDYTMEKGNCSVCAVLNL